MIKLSAKQKSEILAQLKPYIEQNRLFVQYDKGKYCMVEAWEYAGSLMNLTAMAEDCYRVPDDACIKYKAEVIIMDQDSDKEVGRAFAMCTNTEEATKSFEEHAVASMATTRATGKAYRLTIGYLFREMGYEGTPAEEMDAQAEIEIIQISEIRELLKHKKIDTATMESVKSVMMHFDVDRAMNCIKHLKGIIKKK